jgi:hypothetical protein
MIFKYHQLVGIKSRKISLAFRKWDKARVKEGSTMRTAIGVIMVEQVERVTIGSITEADARKAGFEDRDKLLKELKRVATGSVFRVKLKYKSEDPRIALRSKTTLTAEEFNGLESKLARLDARRPWTLIYLKLIAKHPGRRAGDLANMIGMERLAFKLNVRKLKNIGLSISLEVGYKISPMGKMVMAKFKKS